MPESSRAVSRRVGAAAVSQISAADNPVSVRFVHILYRRGTQFETFEIKETEMKAGTVVFKLAVLLAALAAGYAFGFSRGGGAVRQKPADIAAMRMALAEKQAQVAELSAEIWLEERHLNAEEEADYRWVHGDAEVPEGEE